MRICKKCGHQNWEWTNPDKEWMCDGCGCSITYAIEKQHMAAKRKREAAKQKEIEALRQAQFEREVGL